LGHIDETTERRRDLPPIIPPKRVLRIAWSPDTAARGRVFELDGRTWSLGRGATGEGCVRDGRMSREHARFMPGSEVGSYLVRDLGSSNGTFLDGRRIEPDRPAFLLAGQVLSLGGDTLLVIDQEPDPDMLPVGPDASSIAAREIVGISFSSDRLRSSIATVAPANGAVLVLGETGSGKEVTAHAIHRLGSSTGAPFRDVNCANLQPNLAEAELFGVKRGSYTGAEVDRDGFFDQADGGSLFLDEIGELPEPVQAKLLRALEDGTIHPIGGGQSHKVKVRVIGATNAQIDLEGGSFRRDLLARLSVWVLRLPSLAERRADILPLFEHFARMRRPGMEVLECTGEFVEALLLHPWRENVRELRNLVDRLCQLVDRKTPFDLIHLPENLQRPIRLRGSGGAPAAQRSDSNPTFDPARSTPSAVDLEATISPPGTVKRPDRAVIEAALAEADGNVHEASRRNGWHPTQLNRWTDYYQIDRNSFRGKKGKR
jgi:DNA-binding NtrC family response regulator